MKILLVGGLGFIGQSLIKNLIDSHEIIVFTKEKQNNSKKINDFSSLIVEYGNIESREIYDVIIKHNPQIVIHLASLSGLKKCDDDPFRAFSTNVFGTYNVVNACMQTKSRLIFFSSREVYGETQNKESKEEDLLIPNNVYGITKMLAETIVTHTAQKNNLDYTILRISNVYGPLGGDGGVNKIIKNAVQEKKIIINGGKQLLNLVYVDDVTDFITLILDNKKSFGNIFNVASIDNVTIQFFAEKVKSMIGDVIFEYSEQQEIETKYFKPSTEKSKKILGFSTKMTLQDGIEKTLKQYMEIK